MKNSKQANSSRHNGQPLAWLAAAGCLGLIAALALPAPNRANTPAAPITPAADKAAANTTISFNRDIRPILSDKCFACHGPDAAVADDAGAFRLDIFEEATKPATSGDTPIVPGDADASAIISRIQHTNPNLVMPPPKTHTTVTDVEVQLLKRWINEGAKYEGHWAYQTPTKPAIPEISEASEKWAKNNIDRFVAYRLAYKGLKPSKEADRTTLIRRATLDLTGLPPTPEEIDAFVNDTSPNAYEKLVDRLLASEHFGERLALIWLDAARYGDTNGFHHDNLRTAWPWRQWVIEAFNANMPYDQFITEQLAGDLLPNATQQQILASGFCRMHNINDEGGALNDEYLVEAIADRIETIATVMMAQTYTCARCHDHKYDPIPQEDYFSTWAYFNSVQGERGVYRNNHTAARAYPPLMMWKSEELKQQLEDAKAKLAEVQKQHKAAAPSFEADFKAWEQSLRDPAAVQWAKAQLTSAQSNNAGTKVEIKPDNSALLSGEVPATEDITLKLRTDATNLRLIRLDALSDASLPKRSLGRAEGGNAVLTQFVVEAVSVANPNQKQSVKLTAAWADQAQQDGDYDIYNALRDDNLGWAVAGHLDTKPRTALFVAEQPFGFEGGTELHVTLRHQSGYAKHTLGRVRIGVAQANANVVAALPIVSEDWFQFGPIDAKLPDAFGKTYGPESIERISPKDKIIGGTQWVYKKDIVDGKNYQFRSGRNLFFFGRSIFAPDERKLNITLGKRSAIQLYLNGEKIFAHEKQTPAEKGNAQFTITLRPGENTLIAKAVKSGPGNFYYQATPEQEISHPLQPLALIDRADQPKHLTQHIISTWQESTPLGKQLKAAEGELKKLEEQGVPVLIMKEAAQPVPAYILERGAYDKAITDTPIPRKPPSMVNMPMPEGAPDNRLGFAQWLTQDEHPLTARVHVNRLWQMLFGTGIVKSVEDFGNQADWPSHPALLDYLAVHFVKTGWDQKALIKEIVTSATYRQIATHNTAANEIDADNRLLSYFPRQRLKGEFIRDQALFVSGLLNDQIGGPSVKPYQPGDLWNEVAIGGTNTGRFKRDAGEALYRRSMYTFWKKTSPPAQMQIFNAPTREFCTVGRDTTNTPLQVLTLWNDEQFLEAARVLAQRTLAESDDDAKRLELIYRRCTGDVPNADELGVLQDVLAYYRERYNASVEDAKSLLAQGEYPLPEKHDPAELASWMMVASTALSLDETIVRD